MEELTQRLGIASKDVTPSKSESFVVASTSSPTRSRPSSGLPTSTSAELEDAVATYSPRSRALNGIRSRKNSEKSRSTSLSGRSSPTLLTLNTTASEPQDVLKISSLPASAPIDGINHPPSHFLLSNVLDTRTAPQIGITLATSPNTSLPSSLCSSTSTVRGIPTSGDCIPSTRNHTSLDSTPSCGRSVLDDGNKTKSRIPLPRSVTLSKRSSDGNGTPDLASDGGSESTGSLDASLPTPRDRVHGSRGAIGDDTPLAKRIVDSIKTATTGESYGGPSEVSEDMEEEMNVRCTKCNGVLYSLQGGSTAVASFFMILNTSFILKTLLIASATRIQIRCTYSPTVLVLDRRADYCVISACKIVAVTVLPPVSTASPSSPSSSPSTSLSRAKSFYDILAKAPSLHYLSLSLLPFSDVNASFVPPFDLPSSAPLCSITHLSIVSLRISQSFSQHSHVSFESL